MPFGRGVCTSCCGYGILETILCEAVYRRAVVAAMDSWSA